MLVNSLTTESVQNTGARESEHLLFFILQRIQQMWSWNLEYFYEILIIDLVLIWGRQYSTDNGQIVYIFFA